ncbi:hypothetical protein TorRG33x02_352490, partial [Trema orientale]
EAELPLPLGRQSQQPLLVQHIDTPLRVPTRRPTKRWSEACRQSSRAEGATKPRRIRQNQLLTISAAVDRSRASPLVH